MRTGALCLGLLLAAGAAAASFTVRLPDGGYVTRTAAEVDAGVDGLVLDGFDAAACACSGGSPTCRVPNPDAGTSLPAPVGVTLRQWSGTCRPKPCTTLFTGPPDTDETWPPLCVRAVALDGGHPLLERFLDGGR